MKTFALRTADDLRAVFRVHCGMPFMRLGEVLLEEEVISPQQLDDALVVQKNNQSRHLQLGQVLLDLGLLTDERLSIVLAKQLAIPFVKLENFEIDPKVINHVPPEISLQFDLMPLALVNNHLVVAMVDPLNQEAVNILRFNAKIPVELVMASAVEIKSAQNKHYSRYAEDEALEDIEIDIDPVSSTQEDEESLHLIEQEAKKKPIVRLLNAIILQGVNRGASDINIRPERDRVSVYYRVDGHMQFVRALNRSLLAALVSRIKITGQMDISERRLPQDGHARLVHGGKQIDLRISVMPTVDGESVVIRILNKEEGGRPLNQLGVRPEELELIKRLIERPNGIIFVAGPTGSGKTTTLYAILNEVKKRNPHILTIEDPVEYDMEGVEQVQVIKAKNFGFSEALRQFLRHDPDVIMVGEVRDKETAQIANKAAMTGHLVFSTLHTNDSPSSIFRLIDMGIEPYLLATTLLAIISQRLVRLNCPECITEERVDDHVHKVLGLETNELFKHSTGCAECHYTGNKGRVSVIEMLHVTPEIAELIVAGRPVQEISELAISQGMRPLVKGALALARKGKISIQEVYKLSIE